MTIKKLKDVSLDEFFEYGGYICRKTGRTYGYGIEIIGIQSTNPLARHLLAGHRHYLYQEIEVRLKIPVLWEDYDEI